MMSVAVLVSLFFLYSLISRRLEQTIVTAPIVFTVAGMLMFPALSLDLELMRASCPGLLKSAWCCYFSQTPAARTQPYCGASEIWLCGC